jgi:hypothetical protein
MNYTQSDVDKILDASEKATEGPWDFRQCAGLDMNRHEKMAICCGPSLDEDRIASIPEKAIARCGVSTACYNGVLIAGAPILAKEVIRLRNEVEKLHLDLVYQRREFMGDIIDRTL